MDITIATWNINSVRLRAELAARLLAEEQPDVLCLQETKCPQGQFPSAVFHAAGYHHIAERGQVGYHGVAIVSRLPFAEMDGKQFCGKDDARHVRVKLAGPAGLVIHNFYIPAGGDEPDPAINEKFAHKLAFLDEATAWFADDKNHAKHPAVMVGDLNIAPLEHDVWSHKDLLKVVSHTPVEVEKFKRLQQAGGWHDAMRQHVPETEKLYTWWSYRARDWEASNRGRRLDHVWVNAPLTKACSSIRVRKDVRGWERSSDHVPVIARLKL